ncbi:MAG: hypothetical protein KDK78_01275 [Chlamydiia bacterium]|nr:hypothetical protein [Chlamydiia bacterium]
MKWSKFVLPLWLFSAVLTASAEPSPACIAMDKYAYPLMDKFEAAGLQVIGYGGGAMGGINRIAIGMRFQGYPTIDQCRALAIALSNEAQVDAQRNVELQANLKHPPFDDYHIQMVVSFEGEDGTPPVGYVCGIGFCGSVTYYISVDKLSPSRVLHEESLATLREHVHCIGVKEALDAIPKTRAAAAKPFWEETSYEKISADVWDTMQSAYHNPQFDLKFPACTTPLPDPCATALGQLPCK